jgi:serine/threonine-protein kinase
MESGFKLNQYVLVEPLGEGGMAEVWKGRHAHLDFEVAIKFLKPQFAQDRDLQERFLNEGKRQANLDHPNIVRALDFISQRGRHFLVMKYVEGGGLDRHIEESGGPLPLEEVLNISFQVLSALAYAHREGVIHRDVKPSNILMDREGKCYLTDFGIALGIGQPRLTRTGTVMGTDYYISPEQIRSPHTVDARADLYAFGVVLFEMLTGGLPFDYDNEFLLKQAHVEQAPPKPSKLNPAITKAMESVVLCALAKNPDDRWSDCEAMIEALEVARTGTRPPFRRTQPQGAPTPVPRRPSTQPAFPPLRRPSSPVGEGRTADNWFVRNRAALIPLAFGMVIAVAADVGANVYSRHRRDRAFVPLRTSPPATAPARPNVAPVHPKAPPTVGARRRVPAQPLKEGKSALAPDVASGASLSKQPAIANEPSQQVSSPTPLPVAKPPAEQADIPPNSFAPNPGDSVKSPAGNAAFAGGLAGSNAGLVIRPPINVTPNTDRPPSPPPVVAPPFAPPRNPPARASGTLTWSVQLRKNVNESLVEMQPSSGQIHGDPLPGVPVAISISPPIAAGVVEPPSPSNGWTTLRLRGLVNGNIVISIQWRRL